jgi:hypothetical protein
MSAMTDLAPKIAEELIDGCADLQQVWFRYRHATAEEWIRAFRLVNEFAKVALIAPDECWPSMARTITDINVNLEWIVAIALAAESAP